jgi:drug/metabolite transporter (DMT)-like permease
MASSEPSETPPFSSSATRPSHARTLSVLAVGTLAISTAAPFITLAKMHPLTLAAGRLLGVAVLYGVVGRDVLSQWKGLSPQYRRRLIFATPLLTAHFACWIGAFSFTDLPSAVLLLVLQPLLASWFGSRVFREKVTPGILGALALALVGLGLITYDDLTLSSAHLFGDLLVAIASLSMIGFLSVGKQLRPRLSFPAYMSLTYGGAGVWALALVLLFGVRVLGYPPASYGWLLGLILLTTGVGHAAINYVLPHMRLFTLNITVVVEPVLAIVASVLFLGGSVTVAEVLGGAFLIAALLVGVRDETRARPTIRDESPADSIART